jgi:anhydro-N-acetylmuramic acid kinase
MTDAHASTTSATPIKATARHPLYIGLMSGTSLDGVDAALVDFSQRTPRTLATHYAAFAPALRTELASLQAPSENELHRAALAANALAREYAAAVQALLARARVNVASVVAIGAHGQTVRHRPELGFTIQLNNPALLAELTGIAVVADFRSRDVAAGGQGAPLVPAFHQALFADQTQHRVVVNIGGIANITNLPPGGPVSGFDTGPGNCLMDGWIGEQLNQPYDQDGQWAASGRVLPAMLRALLGEAYFKLPPPKSTGRDLFNANWLAQYLSGGEAPADVQATLCALTARTIADAVLGENCAEAAGAKPRNVAAYVCGGGARNSHLMRALCEAAPGVKWDATETLGVPADWVEAVAFAWLARQAMNGVPGSMPGVTGARGARVLGALYPA